MHGTPRKVSHTVTRVSLHPGAHLALVSREINPIYKGECGLERRKLFPSPGPAQVGIRLLWEPFATRGPGFKTKRAGDRSIEWFKQANE